MLELLVWGLATQRLAFLWLTQYLFGPARIGIGTLHPLIQYAVNCQVCVSVWAGIIVYGLWHVSWLGQWLVYALAVSFISVILNHTIEALEWVKWKINNGYKNSAELQQHADPATH